MLSLDSTIRNVAPYVKLLEVQLAGATAAYSDRAKDTLESGGVSTYPGLTLFLATVTYVVADVAAKGYDLFTKGCDLTTKGYDAVKKVDYAGLVARIRNMFTTIFPASTVAAPITEVVTLEEPIAAPIDEPVYQDYEVYNLQADDDTTTSAAAISLADTLLADMRDGVEVVLDFTNVTNVSRAWVFTLINTLFSKMSGQALRSMFRWTGATDKDYQFTLTAIYNDCEVQEQDEDDDAPYPIVGS